jgi:hypothetical protein
MFFALKPNDAVLGDMNAALIGMYQAVANDVEQIIGMLGVHRNAHHRPKYYYEIRDIWNEGGWIDDPSARASAFIYLNKTCFNGLWRVNRKGEFNVPRGDYKNPTVFDPDALRAASVALHKANLRKTAYDQTTATATAGDIVYSILRTTHIPRRPTSRRTPRTPSVRTSNFSSRRTHVSCVSAGVTSCCRTMTRLTSGPCTRTSASIPYSAAAPSTARVTSGAKSTKSSLPVMEPRHEA